MKYLFISVCLLAFVINGFCEMDFGFDLHKHEPEPEPEPKPIYKPIKYKYSFHDDDDDDHWGHKSKKPQFLHIDHSPKIHHSIPEHEDSWWWTTTTPKPKKKKDFIPKEVKNLMKGDFLKDLMNGIGDHKKK